MTPPDAEPTTWDIPTRAELKLWKDVYSRGSVQPANINILRLIAQVEVLEAERERLLAELEVTKQQLRTRDIA